MKIGVVLPGSEVAGAMPGWPEIRDFAVAAEAAAIDSLWIYDHFYYDPEDGSAIEGQHEAWTLLSAVAAVTERAELGTLVLCSTFRDPGLVAKMAAALDEVSGGRLILGLGAGWHDPEYDAFGFPKDRRVDRFEEALQVIVPLLDGGSVTFQGKYHELHEASLVPAPARRIPVLIACEGPRMLGLTARYADAWNTAWYGAPDDALREAFSAMDAAAAEQGRRSDEITKTVGITIRDVSSVPSDTEEPAFEGSVEELARVFDGYEALGADHLICSLEPSNISSLERVRAAIQMRS
ncbi:MAG: LLM class flavin-dependent oxidoreductase [Actinobacteria bacterium]|nr:LLM class flavin-dependent oxidoreductase [Actinomycetota bacterium]